MNVETITNNWDRENKDRIDRNFKNLSKLPISIIKDLLRVDPSISSTKVNGLKTSPRMDLRSLNEYGVNFKTINSSIIYNVKIYADRSGKMGIGLVEQRLGEVSGAQIGYIIVDLVKGWNSVPLLFEVEAGKEYTLFKRMVAENILTNTQTVDGWSTFPDFINSDLKFQSGKHINQESTVKNYSTFFEIETVSNPAQVFKILNDRAKSTPQFYVGTNPPGDVQFWFKPVGS